MKKLFYTLSFFFFLAIPSSVFANGTFTATNIVYNPTLKLISFTASNFTNLAIANGAQIHEVIIYDTSPAIDTQTCVSAGAMVTPTHFYTFPTTTLTNVQLMEAWDDNFCQNKPTNYPVGNKIYFNQFGDQYYSQTILQSDMQNPPPTNNQPQPDPAALSATTNTITGLKNSNLVHLTNLIPLAFGLLISVALVYFIHKHFKSLSKIR